MSGESSQSRVVPQVDRLTADKDEIDRALSTDVVGDAGAIRGADISVMEGLTDATALCVSWLSP